MTECTPCTALRAFTEFVPGFGQVHGDPDSKDNKMPNVPNGVIDKLVGEDKIEAPEAVAPEAQDDETEEKSYSDMSKEKLAKLATELGIMPETGSGVGGAVVKNDIVAALEKADSDSAPA